MTSRRERRPNGGVFGEDECVAFRVDCRCSSTVEHRFRKAGVVGSNPTIGSRVTTTGPPDRPLNAPLKPQPSLLGAGVHPVDEQLVAFIRAIRADPADDTVRLACADWYEENEEVGLATFIRAHIRLDRLHALGESRSLEEDRELELLASRVRELRDGSVGSQIREILDGSGGSLYPSYDLNLVRRGFPEAIEWCLPSWWMRRGDEVYARFPILEVTFLTPPPCEETEGCVLIIGDPRGEPLNPTGHRQGEFVVLAACRTRWPFVRFEVHPQIHYAHGRATIGAVQARGTATASRVSTASRLGTGK
jgi:uncharacterized protein (TIGR02996 family)